MSGSTHMTDVSLIVEQRSDALYVTLNRPERRNAMNDAMVAQLDAVLDRLEAAKTLLRRNNLLPPGLRTTELTVAGPAAVWHF